MAFTEDLTLFFDPDGFAIEAVFNLSPTPRTASVIFNTPSQAVDIYDAQVEADAPNLLAKTSDLSGVKRGTTVTVNSVAYKVERIADDGTGVSTVYLSK
ncbi:MAG TPA: head-tail joining protein [Pyrinomonadaceae bacterium]|jgi:hypothetical protein